MLQDGKLMPNLDGKTIKALSLTVLQRIDPSVEEILTTGTHVSLYDFSVDTNQWSRKDAEGTLFVVKRNTQPQFQFIVMNRLSTDNVVENLLGDFEYEVQVPYILYRNAAQDVNGIWFYNARECEEVSKLFSRILNAYSKVPTNSTAKSDCEELETVPTLGVMNELPSSTTAIVAYNPDDPSFANFSRTAMNTGGAPNSVISEQPYHSSTNVISRNVISPDKSEPNIAAKHSADLVKPSSFCIPPPSPSPLVISPVSSSIPTAPPLSPIGGLQRPQGKPLLQPFPLHTPPSSHALTSVPTVNYGSVISRENIQEALHMLVEDNQFVDLVYGAVAKARRL